MCKGVENVSDTPAGQVTPFRPQGFTVQRNSASQQLRNKYATDLKNLQQNREKLLGDLYEVKAKIDDVDVAIDTLANAINRLDRERLMNPGADES